MSAENLSAENTTMTAKMVTTLQESEWLVSRREEALRIFNELEIPKLKFGLSIKMELNDFSFEKFEEPEIPQQKIKAPEEAIVLDLSDALQKYPELMKQKFMSLASAETKFGAFHSAKWKKATVVIIPENIELKKPIEIKTVFSKTNVENLLVFAHPNSSATIIDTTYSNGENEKLNSRVVEIFAEENSRINFLSLQNCDEKTYTFSTKRAVASNDAVVNWLECNFGSKICLSETTTILDGDGSSTENLGVFFGSGTQKFDLHSKSVHIAKNTSSNMLTKGALNDYAKAIYRGVLKVESQANGASAYQKEDVLLMSQNAEADSIPELRINNNNVKKCTHGAGIGQLDREKLFYLMSRGLTEKEAKRKIIGGFLNSVLSKISNLNNDNAGNEFTGEIRNLIEEKLN